MEKARKTTTDIRVINFDPMDHPYFAQKNLIVGILADIGVFFGFLLLPKLILFAAESFDFAEFLIVTIPASIILPYGIGCQIGYSAVKVFRIHRSSKDANALRIDSGMMSGYSQSQTQSEKWSVWLYASAAGFINLVIFTISLEEVKKLL